MKQVPRFARIEIVTMLAAALFLALVALPVSQDRQVAAAPVRISIEQFDRYIREWSEPEGYFDSDNFISNETSYLHVIDELRERVRPGAVYIGVGPDQNLSYIAHARPALAVIVDIRRQNLLQHLLFKAIFDQSSSRVDYLALLLARQKPAVASGAGFQEILRAIRSAPTSDEIFRRDLDEVKSVLRNKHRLKLSAEDFKRIEYVYRTFWQEGLDLRFSTIGRASFQRYPTFEELLLETDRAGRLQNYLSSEELFQWLKAFQSENRLIPIVGDFAGSHAFKTLAGFLKQNGLQVSSFYTSNVEFYLFGRPSWIAFMENVRALPITDDAVFIRAYFSTYGRSHPLNVPGHRSTSLVHAIGPFVADYDAGRIPTYWEVVQRRK
jgi:hypothetical protein